MTTGSILIGASEEASAETFNAIDPSTGQSINPAFTAAGPDHASRACALADAAFPSFSETSLEARAAFLEAVAAGIAAIGDELIGRAMAETGLPRARLEGERGRTIGQLCMFAAFVRKGDWLHATIDPALPNRAPLPRPDLRRRHVALGPVAVFGASNFPLAFSVAGGDTASAFAAGCPVVVKGHPAHPGTGELVARAIQAAVRNAGLHEGVFSYLPGPSKALGAALVADPRIKAVAFTGSRVGGFALAQIAAARHEPIPVYAEMSSINPVILFPAALRNRAESIAQGFAQSLTMGAGQFCTNPGMLIAVDGPDLDRFVAAAGEALSTIAPATMLTPDIHASFEAGVCTLERNATTRLVARGGKGSGIYAARGALFVTDADGFRADTALAQEVFGSSAVIVRCRDMEEVRAVIAGLEGQLTATLQLDEEDEALAVQLLPLIERKVGRMLANGWPTGVEVCHAMVHGGPTPATSDGRSTSVGTLAIERFLRPVSYQNFPENLLPAALKPANPWNIARRVDGALVSGE